MISCKDIPQRLCVDTQNVQRRFRVWGGREEVSLDDQDLKISLHAKLISFNPQISLLASTETREFSSRFPGTDRPNVVYSVKIVKVVRPLFPVNSESAVAIHQNISQYYGNIPSSIALVT